MNRSGTIRLGFALACLGILFARNVGAFYYPLQQEFAASQFSPGVAKIMVTSLEGQGAAEFDLDALK